MSGICAACPDISFDNKYFCITGELDSMPRATAVARICDAGGYYAENVTKKLNYLVVGASGNPCWAYSCYGRKIEQAVGWRKRGAKMIIVHENDFLDALQDMH